MGPFAYVILLVLILILAGVTAAGVWLIGRGIRTLPALKMDDKPSTSAGVILIVFGAVLLLPALTVVIRCLSPLVYPVTEAVRGRNNLSYQVLDGSVSGVERLLNSGTDPDCRRDFDENVPATDNEMTLLGCLAQRGSAPENLEKMRLLIDHGADVNRAMCTNCRYEHLLGTHLDFCSSTPLMFACVNHNYDAAELLIENGAEINAVNYYGQSPLDIVEEELAKKYLLPDVRADYEQIKELLLSLGAKHGSEINSEGESE